MSWIGTTILAALVLAPAYLIGRRICERVRAARWRRIREPRNYGDNCGDDGGRPTWRARIEGKAAE